MSDIAKYVRLFDPSPSDDLVEKRTSAINALNEEYISEIAPVNAILALANAVAITLATNVPLSDDLAKEVEEAIRKFSPAFVRDEHENEMLVCLLISLLLRVKNAKPSSGTPSRTDVMAAGLWSALSFQPTLPNIKLEALREDILNSCQTLILASADNARNRLTVPDFSVSSTPEISAFVTSFKPGTDKTIAALRTNAKIDREEIDLLWWFLSDWSELLGERFSTMHAEAAAVLRGIEVGKKLLKLPSEAHKHLVLRNLTADTQLSLPELVASLGERRIKIAEKLDVKGTSMLSQCPAVFSLLSALHTGQNNVAGSEVTRSVREWGARALLEASILFIKLPD